MSDREQFFREIESELERAEQQADEGDIQEALHTATDAARRVLLRIHHVELKLSRKLDRIV